MNRRRYRFHPGDYELGENEKFYGDMEAQGWRLVSRGAFLSRFAPAEPSAARYRVEVAEENYYAYLTDEDMDDGRLAVFADCGWEFVTGRRLLRIFRAPAGSGAPGLLRGLWSRGWPRFIRRMTRPTCHAAWRLTYASHATAASSSRHSAVSSTQARWR